MFKQFFTPSFASKSKRHIERRILQTPPLHLFQIIQDVDSYREFLPMCKHSETIRESTDGRSFDARLTIGYPPLFSETYVSRVTVVPESLVISAESIESHWLDHLSSKWTLSPVRGQDGDGDIACHVDFQVQMAVSNPLIASTLDRVLQEVAGRQVEAFEKRCHETEISPEILEFTKATASFGGSSSVIESSSSR